MITTVIAVTVRYPNVAPTLTAATGAADLTGAITEDASPVNTSGVLDFADINAEDLPTSLTFSTGIASSVAKSDSTLDHDLPADPPRRWLGRLIVPALTARSVSGAIMRRGR